MNDFLFWMRRILCWPLILYGYLAVLFFKITAKGDIRWLDGIPIVTIPENTWPLKIAKFGGITFGHGIVLVKELSNEHVVRHEMVHVEQTESMALAGLILGTICALSVFSWASIAVLLICWMGCTPMAYISSSLIALLRREDFYKGNNLEEGARGE